MMTFELSNTISSKKVNHIGPLGASILIVGEAPGRDEEREGIPFAGKSGDLLNQLLSNNGFNRDDCRIANICNYRPADNEFDYCIDTWQLKESLEELNSYIAQYPPKIILGLGNVPLKYLCNKNTISNWRGSLINTTNGNSYFASLHPAYILHSGTGEVILDFDFRKFRKHWLQDNREALKKDFIIDPKGYSLEELAIEIEENYSNNSKFITIDIESRKDSSYIICCGFGLSEERAVCILNHTPFEGMSIEFENFCRRILENPSIKKVLHNAIFDREMFRLNGIIIKNIIGDTILAQHVLTPELPRDLGFLCSIYTDHPCYWGDLSVGDDKQWSDKSNRQRLYEYNCMDVIVTYEVYKKQLPIINEDKCYSYTYNHELELLELSYHLSESGYLVDTERRDKLFEIVDTRFVKDQILLNNIAQQDVNVRSGPQVNKYLYETLGLPVRKNHEGRVTADEDAIVSLIGFAKDKYNSSVREDTKYEWKKKVIALKLILKIRGYRQLKSNYLTCTLSNDGRIRSSWKVAGTGFGRLSCSGYVDGTGLNAQTFPREVISDE